MPAKDYQIVYEEESVNAPRGVSQRLNVGENNVPLILALRCFEFSNSPGPRANPSSQVATFKLPFPEVTSTGARISYNEELAKEQGVIAKMFTERANMKSNFWNLSGRIVKDTFQSLSGVDLGRRPMDVTELSFVKAEKRKYSFNWVFTSISYGESENMVEMARALTAFSLPSTAGRGLLVGGGSTRMIMPHMWTMEVLDVEAGGGGMNTKKATDTFLEQPKTCFLTNVSVDRDSSALMRSAGRPNDGSKNAMPISFALSLDFTEIDPVLRDPASGNTNIISRSEVRSGSGETYES